MNSSLPRLSPARVLLTVAALTALRDDCNAVPPAATTAQPAKAERHGSEPSIGDKLLLQAASMLERRASVSARLRHQVFLGGQQLYGVGSYWQQGSGVDLRVRLELQIAGQEASLLQISTSRFLWVDRRLPTGRSVSRIDLRQLRADPRLGAPTKEDIAPGNATWSSVEPALIAHSGGLPSLLASLSENFSFLPPQAMRLAPQAPSPNEAQSGSIPVFAVVGHWKHQQLMSLLERRQESKVEGQEPETLDSHLSALNSLPDRLPQEVLLLVGQADLFPYRVEYRRLETPLAANRDSPPIPYQLSAAPLAVLELSEVAFDGPIAAGQFDYTPGEADFVDQTADLLERLHRRQQQQIAVRPQPDSSARPIR